MMIRAIIGQGFILTKGFYPPKNQIDFKPCERVEDRLVGLFMVVRSFFRVIISLVGAALPLLFLSGSYSPLGSYLPNLLNMFGKESSLGILLGIQASPVLPIGAAGLTGFATYSVLQRVLRTAQAATYSPPNMDMSQMMRQVQNMMPAGIGVRRETAGPMNLPNDMTRSQYLILTKYQQ